MTIKHTKKHSRTIKMIKLAIQPEQDQTKTRIMRKSQLSRSILIIQPGNTGDIAIASPIAEALKNTYPNARISWLTEPISAHLLHNNTNVDEVIIWDKAKWNKLRSEKKLFELCGELLTLVKELKHKKFDTVLDLQGQFSTGLIAWLSNAKQRIGLASHKGSHWFMTKTISSSTGDKIQIGSQYRYLCDQLELTYSNWNMQAPTSSAAKKRATNLLTQQNINDEYVAIAPYSNSEEYHWPEEHWQQLILRIRGKHNLRAIILADKRHQKNAEELAKACGAISLSGIADTEESNAIIKSARLCIGIDCELTHLGYALRTPTIALFGPSCPYSFTEFPASKIIYTDRFCSPCNNNPTCKGAFQCMSEISPDKVLTEIKSLLKQHH